MNPRIGVVTGGGDCPGLNAVIRAVAKAAHRRGWQAVGISGGYEGLLAPQHQVERASAWAARAYCSSASWRHNSASRWMPGR